jgi:hypothetical protein
MEGAYVTRHVTGNQQAVDIARRVADLLIALHCPDSDGTASAAVAASPPVAGGS